MFFPKENKIFYVLKNKCGLPFRLRLYCPVYSERLQVPSDQNASFLNSSFPWSNSEVSLQSWVVFTMKTELLLQIK